MYKKIPTSFNVDIVIFKTKQYNFGLLLTATVHERYPLELVFFIVLVSYTKYKLTKYVL